MSNYIYLDSSLLQKDSSFKHYQFKFENNSEIKINKFVKLVQASINFDT